MGEKTRIRIAMGILTATGGLVLWSAIDPAFKTPPEMWGLATAAAAYCFSTAKRSNDGD